MRKLIKRGDKNIKKKKKAIMVITIITNLVILLSSHIAYAKYVTVDSMKSSLSIAIPIFIVEGGEIARISETNEIGYYEFVVKNYNSTNISEIGFIYTIEIISNIDKTIQLKLYRDDKPITLNNLKTENLLIKGKQKEEHKYKLQVTYDGTKSISQKDILGEIQVKVHSEQEE